MIVINDRLLDYYRRLPACEWCGRKRKRLLHPHHLFCRGMGGGGRLDVELNLMGLCWQCHDDYHNGRIDRMGLIAKVAAREGLLIDQLIQDLHSLIRRSK